MTTQHNGQPYHMKIELEFDLDNGDMQHDNMNRFKEQIEELSREIFRSHVSSFKSRLSEAKPIE